VAGLTLHVTAVDKQGMASTQKRFDLGQQGDVGHGVFLVVNKEKTLRLSKGCHGGLTVTARRHVCVCQRRVYCG